MNSLKTISIVLLAGVFAGCNGLGKMEKNASLVKYAVTPNPLEMHGDSVALTVSGTYPPKYFAKKIALSITPVIKTVTGEKAFAPINVVGEKVEANGTKINSKAGGSFSYSGKVGYTPDMRAGDVMVNIKGAKGTTTKDFAPMKIADATITTPLLVKSDEMAIMAKDNFQKIVPVKFDGRIFYLIMTSKVNPAFTVKNCGLNNKKEMAALDSIFKMCATNNITMKGIDIMGNASPDGKENLNAGLADARSKSTMKYLMDLFKKNKMPVDSSFFHLSVNNEDWAGFQRLMQNSDMGQKDMILRIVASNSDVDAREMEIKKMGKAYTEIADAVLPKLRKSDITVNAEKMARTDEQISALATSNPDSLGLEEILYAGTLTADMSKKVAIYQSAERIYPQDWRCANNSGAAQFMMKNLDAAMAEFKKADNLAAGNPIVQNNLGACYRQKGDRATATRMYAAASGAGDEVNQNMAIIDILNGNYGNAVSHCGTAKTFNAALAQLLAGDKEGAVNTVNASPDKDSAIGYYLKAVAAARKADPNGVVMNLKSSIEKDASMKAMAKDDREFIKWFNDVNFKAVVQ